MQTSAAITGPATQAIIDFVRTASGCEQLTQNQAQNALMLVVRSCEECRSGFSLSRWHQTQPVHAFEALSCSWKGVNHRWPPLTLNLHFTEKPDGTALIATPEELPLKPGYFVKRVINDAACSADGV